MFCTLKTSSPPVIDQIYITKNMVDFVTKTNAGIYVKFNQLCDKHPVVGFSLAMTIHVMPTLEVVTLAVPMYGYINLWLCPCIVISR